MERRTRDLSPLVANPWSLLLEESVPNNLPPPLGRGAAGLYANSRKAARLDLLQLSAKNGADPKQ